MPSKPPPAPSAPGPAGLGTAATGFFDDPAFGTFGLPLPPIAASSSASKRAASALRAAAASLRAFSSATRGFSLFAPFDHFVVSWCSYYRGVEVGVLVIGTVAVS